VYASVCGDAAHDAADDVDVELLNQNLMIRDRHFHAPVQRLLDSVPLVMVPPTWYCAQQCVDDGVATAETATAARARPAGATFDW
jgi:hypothetical protein